MLRHSIQLAMEKFRARLAEEGPTLRAYRAARHGLEWLGHERRQAVDTSSHIPLESLGVDHPDRIRYEPASWTVLRTVLPKSSVRSTDVFVDFGSGMGRVVQQAAAYPFARVIGVEVSEHLNEIARLNFERNRRRFACQSVEFVTCDAVEFRIPDEMTHAFLYNPFTGETFRKVMQSITASLDRCPRRLILFYEEPTMRKVVEETDRFRLLDEKRTAPRRITAIYESRPQGGRPLQ